MPRRLFLVVVILLIAAVLSLHAVVATATLFSNTQDRVKVTVIPRDEVDKYTDEFTTAAAENPERIVPMGFANGSAYKCLLPPRSSTKDDDNKMWRKHLQRLRDHPLPTHLSNRLYIGLSDVCFTHPAGWWTYKLCWGKSLRQFHADSAGKVETEYILGEGPLKNIEDGASDDILYDVDPTNPTKARLIAEWFNGTTCDLSGKPRHMVLQMYCPEPKGAAQVGGGGGGSNRKQHHQQSHQQHQAGTHEAPSETFELSVLEPVSCQYAVTLKHPAFCNVPELKARSQPEVEVKCIEVTAKQEQEQQPVVEVTQDETEIEPTP